MTFHEYLIKHNDRIMNDRNLVMEFIEEVAKGPYKDSSLESLMDYYTHRAKKIQKDVQEGIFKAHRDFDKVKL